MIRIVCAACILVCAVACARANPASARPASTCSLPVSRVVDTDSLGVDGHSVVGRVVAKNDGEPLTEATVSLLADAVRSQVTDSTGAFQFERLPSGRYRLVARRIGYRSAADSVTLPIRHPIEIQLVPSVEDELACFNERILAEGPVLRLERADSLTVERVLPGGPRIRHTVVASRLPDGISFRSRIVNLGPGPARITRLCYPKAAAPVLKELVFVGPTCYGSEAQLAPGDSGIITTGGPLRGQPGRYDFHVHAVDPALLDVTIRVKLVQETR